MLAESYSQMIKKLLSFDKLVTEGEEINSILTVVVILLNYLTEAQGMSLLNSVFESCSSSNQTEAFFILLGTCLDEVISQDIILVKEDKAKLKIMACVKVFSLVFKWLIQRVDYFLLSRAATPELLAEIAGVLPE